MSSDNPQKTAPAFDPAEDGVSHINVFTRGRTKLGRDLSNFQECNIVHPYFGRFRTLEGLWFYLKTGRKEELFRVLNGHDAKKQGKLQETVHYALFTKMFKLGIVEKLAKSDDLRRELLNNELPLVHYYNFGGNVVVPQRQEWQIEFWQVLRDTLLAAGNLDNIRKELSDYIDRAIANPEREDEQDAVSK